MAGDSAFETVLRGYDRRQVDEFILRQEEAAETLRTALAETERKLQVATDPPNCWKPRTAGCMNR